MEILKNGKKFYRVIGVQNIDDYTMRDRARPARDAKVGMLPPKLAQILINLCGPLPAETRLLDPFCGTGVVLQEAALMGYQPYGTDLDARMVEYSRKNLEWLVANREGSDSLSRPSVSNPSFRARISLKQIEVEQGDATSFQWQSPIQAVASELFLGQPMSQAPAEIKLKQESSFVKRWCWVSCAI